MDRVAVDLCSVNPDNVALHESLHADTYRPGDWIFSSDTPAILERLGLSEDIYSCEEPTILEVRPKTPTHKAAVFPCEDKNLRKFLDESRSKLDVIKPFNGTSQDIDAHSGMYLLRDATVICSRISICILDKHRKIVKACSHNSAESLKVWSEVNSGVVPTEIDEACFASVQQTFNMGHWFIDTVPRLLMLAELSNKFRRMPWIIDTNEHIVIKSTLDSLQIESSVPSWPFGYFSVRRLYVPFVNSFDERVILGQEVMTKNAQLDGNKGAESVWGHQSNKRVFLSRQGQKRRRVINWSQVSSLLREHNILILKPEEHGFSEMMAILEDADEIIAPNGAALCNMLLSKNTSMRVKVMYPPSHLDDYYYRVSMALKKSFFGIATTKEGSVECLDKLIEQYYYPRVDADYEVDIERLNKLITAE